MTARVPCAVPTTRHDQSHTAFPPLGRRVPTMAEWSEAHHNRPPLWRRLFQAPRAASSGSTEPGALPSHTSGVEAVAGNGEG